MTYSNVTLCSACCDILLCTMQIFVRFGHEFLRNDVENNATVGWEKGIPLKCF